MTLLQNEGDLLPLDVDALAGGEDSVAVVGPKADSPEGQLGDYAFAAHYPDRDANRAVVTPLDALRSRLGTDAVAYAEGCSTTGPETDGFDDAVAAAADADVAVAFVGTRSAIALSDADADRDQRPDVPTSGEVDATQLAYHDRDMDLVVEEGAYEVRVGRSSEDVRATGSVEVTDTKRVPRTGRTYFTETSVGPGE